VPPAGVDLELELELGDALLWTGRADEALRRADDLAERGSAGGDRLGELCERIQGGLFALDLEPDGAAERLAVLVEQALPVFGAAEDDLALCIAYTALAEVVGWRRGRMDAGLEATERAFAHARQAGYLPPGSMGSRAAFRFFGTTPASELLAWLDEVELRAGGDQFLRAYRAGSLAMLGRFDEARAILAEARADQAERGGGALLANLTAFESVWVELWAGDPSAAAAFGAEGFRLHEELGSGGFLSGAAVALAQALYALDRLDEAEAWADRSEELRTGDEPWREMVHRQVKAKVLARRGEHPDAERLAREAVAIGDETDRLDPQGDAYADLAEVLLLVGKVDDAAAALEQALGRYERKENLVSAERMRTRLRELELAG
jgi:tetratricopeptide (TPR) repeat protein